MTRKAKSKILFPFPFEKCKHMFDIFTYAFILIGADVLEKGNRQCRAFRYVSRCLFYITSFIGLLTGSFHFGFLLDGFRMEIFSPIIYIYSGLLFSFVLHYKKEDFIFIFQILSDHNMKGKHINALRKKRRKCLITLLIYVMFLFVLLSISTFLSLFSGNSAVVQHRYPAWTSAVEKISPYFDKVYSILLYSTSVFCCVLPLLMYDVICGVLFSYLNEIMNEVKNSVMSSPLDIKYNHKLYKRAKCLVELVSSKLRHVNTFGILLFSSLFYFNLFSEIQSCFLFKGHRIIDSALVVIVAIIAAKITNDAGEIPIINEQILSIVNESSFENNLMSQRIAFVLQIQQGLSLTVGGVIAVNKGWCLILFGTLITYSLLIKSL